MTTWARHADDDGAGDSADERALRLYAEHPLRDGDAVLLLDGTVCLELERMADEWDDRGRRDLVQILAQTSRRVVVAIARPRAQLRPGDYQLWRDLHRELDGTAVELLPVRALPAA